MLTWRLTPCGRVSSFHLDCASNIGAMGGRGTLRPAPRVTSSWPLRQTTLPWLSVTAGTPVTVIPSNTLTSSLEWWVFWRIVWVALGSQTTRSASEPLRIAPFCG